MKKLLFILLIILFFLSFRVASAEGNKFGIHILEPSDLDKASLLVNSSGGDWGWVTVVIRDDDLNFAKWQDFMDECREKHLIPLVRIATHQESENWSIPLPSDSQNWAKFLNNLNWPVKDRYVIIFNEPNQAKEWGGKLRPDEYALILNSFIDEFKKTNPNFKILNAGFDLSASNSKSTMDAFTFWQKMEKKVPGIFNKLDAWASHSYPNNNKTLRLSIRGYEWEISTLRKYFGLQKSLPIFITETGWNNDNSPNYIKSAFEDVWLKDKRVVAVTPFVLNYPYSPFSKFSWLDQNGDPYLQYEVIRNMPKEKWWPEQEEKYSLGEVILPPFMLTESVFEGKIPIRNQGQSILGEKDKFILPSSQGNQNIYVSSASLSKILEPNEDGFLDFQIKTSTSSGEFEIGWKDVGNFKIKVFSPSVVRKVELSIWQKIIFNLGQFSSHFYSLLLNLLNKFDLHSVFHFRFK